MAEKKTQQQMVLEHLQRFHHITDLEAYRDMGVRRLSAVIWSLRSAGFPIRTESTTRPNRYGKPTTFATYILED